MREPAPRGRATVDANGVVVAYQRPKPNPFRLSEQEKLERALWQRIEWAGLPLPKLEYRFALSEGRQYRADGAYVEQRILIEVDGGIWQREGGPGRHNRGSGYEEDCRKYNLAAVLNWRVFRFTERLIKDGTAIETLKRALQPAETLFAADLTTPSEVNCASSNRQGSSTAANGLEHSSRRHP